MMTITMIKWIPDNITSNNGTRYSEKYREYNDVQTNLYTNISGVFKWLLIFKQKGFL